MAKVARRPMVDALSELSAQTVAREENATAPNHESTIALNHESVIEVNHDRAVTLQRGLPKPLTRQGIKSRQAKQQGRRPHTSFYADERVFRLLKEIALVEGCRPHDVLMEGVRMVFARYGYNLDEIKTEER